MKEKPKPKLKVQDVVQLHAVFGPDGPFTWIHTHGLVTYGYPELEIRNLPVFMLEDGGRLLNQIGQYMLDNKVAVKAGENMQIGERRFIHFWEPPPYPEALEHYEVERLAIVDPPGLEHRCCEECGGRCEENLN